MKSLDITYGLLNMKGHKTHTFLHVYDLLGLFAELQKGTISIVMSVFLSIIMKKLGSHRTDFHELRYLINPYPTAFLYGKGTVLHFYQQQESSTTKTVHKVINKGFKTYV